MRVRKQEQGFTLVEIMIVVAIVGMLAAIVVPNFIRARITSRTNVCVNNLRMIAAAKDLSAIELRLAETATPTTTQITPYLKTPQLVNGLPKEPQNGAYNVGALSLNPTCSVGGDHTL